MGNKIVKQEKRVAQAAISSSQVVEEVAQFNADGSPFALVGVVEATTAVAIGTAAKTVTNAEPAAGSLVVLKFTSGNSAASPTVAFNGGTARAVLLGGTAPSGAEATFAANGVGFFWFDGTSLHQIGLYS